MSLGKLELGHFFLPTFGLFSPNHLLYVFTQLNVQNKLGRCNRANVRLATLLCNTRVRYFLLEVSWSTGYVTGLWITRSAVRISLRHLSPFAYNILSNLFTQLVCNLCYTLW